MSSHTPKINNPHACIMGAGGCGKSSLTIQYVCSIFSEDYDPTIEDSYRKQVVVDDEPCLLDILDTAGQEGTPLFFYFLEYSAMRDSYCQQADCFVLVYSVTSAASFEEIPNFLELIYRCKDSENIPMVLVGNKVDIVNEDDSLREVATDDARELAKKHNINFFEASARTRYNVTAIFEEAIRSHRVHCSGLPQKKKRRKSKSKAFRKLQKKMDCTIL